MKILGRTLFYLLWPFVWVYAPLTRRVRIIVLCDGELLLVKNWFGSGHWQLPGGGIKMGESVLSAAQRELEEELGVKNLKLLILHDEPKIIKQSGLLMRYHFVSSDLSHKQKLIVSRSITDVEWQKIDNLEGVLSEVVIGMELVSQQG